MNDPGLETEGDVETHFVFTLLTDPSLLAIPKENVRNKRYLAPTTIDKRGGKPSGYLPDFSVWLEALPLLIVEVKKPDVDVEVGYREAGLYAFHLNKQFRTGLNPCGLILSTNGLEILAGNWDDAPKLRFPTSALVPGGAATQELKNLCGYDQLASLLPSLKKKSRPTYIQVPYVAAGGVALLNAKRPLNTFAAPLSPVLRKFFTSQDQNRDPSVYRDGYISSEETTSHDQILDSLMKERVVELRGPLSEEIRPTKRGERRVEKAVKDFRTTSPSGQLQLITGTVGAGKSLFMRRYKEMLQSPDLEKDTYWSFVDFNLWNKSDQQDWLCQAFVNSFGEENDYDAYDSVNWPQVFSLHLNRRKGIYEDIAKSSTEQAAMARANDLNAWIADPKIVAFGLARHFLGERRKAVVAVMDNVDKLETSDQLDIFNLALWFMAESRAFVVLNLRDETYERFKHEKPLDTYRSGITFHVSPPRFADVVKRRMELSIGYLEENVEDTIEYSSPSGLRITYKKDKVGDFLSEIFQEVFDRQDNTSRIIQGLAGRDVRRALEIFESVLRSGHLGDDVITSRVQGGVPSSIEEDTILRALMRGEYRFHSDNSGYVKNVFYCDVDWVRPSNFLLVDLLYELYARRLKVGAVGLQGYHSVDSIAEEFALRGYVEGDVFSAANYLLAGNLVEAEHFESVLRSSGDSIKVTYSGFIHLRFMLPRNEYVYGVLPTSPVFNSRSADQIVRVIAREADGREIDLDSKIRAITAFYDSLKENYIFYADAFPKFGGQGTGASYVVNQLDVLTYNLTHRRRLVPKGNPLDLL